MKFKKRFDRVFKDDFCPLLSEVLKGFIYFILSVGVLPDQIKSQTVEACLMVPEGQLKNIRDAKFSPNDKILLIRDAYGMVLPFDVESGRELALYPELGRDVTSIDISPDSKLIAASFYDKSIKIYNVSDGSVFQEFENNGFYGTRVSFSHSGDKVIVMGSDNKVRIFGVSDGELKILIDPANQVRNYADFSFNDESIFISNSDGSARVYDSITGKEQNSMRFDTEVSQQPQISPFGNFVCTVSSDSIRVYNFSTKLKVHSYGIESFDVRSVIFNLEETHLLVQGWHGGSASLIEINSGRRVDFSEKLKSSINCAEFSTDGKKIIIGGNRILAIYDIESKTEKYLLNRECGNVGFAVFSSNAKMSLISFSEKEENNLILIDNVTGRKLSNLTGQSLGVYCGLFLPRDNQIVSFNGDLSVQFRDAKGENLNRLLMENQGFVNSFALAYDDTRLITSSNDSIVRIYNLMERPSLEIIIKVPSIPWHAKISPNGEYSAIACRDSLVRIYKNSNGELHRIISGHLGEVYFLEFSPDGKSILTSSLDATNRIFLISDGMELSVFGNHRYDYNYGLFDDYGNISKANWISGSSYGAFGKTILTVSSDSIARIYDISNGKVVNEFGDKSSSIRGAIFNSEKNLVLTINGDHTGIIYDITNKSDKRILKGSKRALLFGQFSPDDKYAVLVYRDFSVCLFDVSTGMLLHVLRGHEGHVLSVSFSFDGRLLLTTGSDDRTILWDVLSGKPKYYWVSLDDNNWLAYDDDYHYDGTPAAREQLYFTCGLEIIELSQLKDALYVPGLVEKIMSGQPILYPKLSELEICGTLPLIEKMEDAPYHYTITPRKLGLKRVEVYVNGKRVMMKSPEELNKKEEHYEWNIEEKEIQKFFVPGEENQVKVIGIVQQGNNEMQSRGVVEEVEPTKEEKQHPTFYGLMVGVSDYKDDRLDLKYPTKDSKDLGKVMESAAKKLLNTTTENHVKMYYVNSEVKGENGYATPEREGVKKALQAISKEAKAEDVVMIFFAGHGVMEGDKDKRFTFLTAESTKENLVGISTKDLEEWMSGTNGYLPNKTILIFDACNSGQATEELMAMARDDEETQRIRQVEDLKDKSGMFIMSASAANQSAYELPRYGHGLLTYSLLKTLKTSSGTLDEEKFINVQKWFLETETTMDNLTRELGVKQEAQPFGRGNIRVGELDEEIRSGIEIQQEKPMVYCANALNISTTEDDLHLKEYINQTNTRSAEDQYHFVWGSANAFDIEMNIVYEPVENGYEVKVKWRKKQQTLKSLVFIDQNEKNIKDRILLETETILMMSK